MHLRSFVVFWFDLYLCAILHDLERNGVWNAICPSGVNSHFLISLQAYKLYCFRYRWSGNCFPESESPETDFLRIRNQNKTGFFTGLISSAGAYPVSKKLSAFWLVTIFNQKFMVFLRWPWSIKNGHLWLGQNISVLVLSLNIYRFLFISIKYFFIKLYFFIILSRGQVHRWPKYLNRLGLPRTKTGQFTRGKEKN